jgi:AraC-like DNA-binding protein
VQAKSLPFAGVRQAKDNKEHFKPHFHQRLSIGAVLDGELLFILGEDSLRLSQGELALINPQIIHACNPEKSASRSYVMLYLDTHWCAHMQGKDEFIPFQNPLIKDKTVVNLYFEAINSFFEPQIFEMQIEEKLVEFFGALLEKEKLSKKPAYEPNIQKAKEALASNLDEEIALGKLAKNLRVDMYGFIRSFKEALGVTPHAFRLNCRIEAARGLLQEGKSIAEVAQECGFYDQSHFHHHFKAMTTQTPKAYQRNFLQD